MDGRIKKIAFSGLFISTSIVLTRFFAANVVVGGLSTLRLSFGQVPLFLGGILLGPMYGAVIGALADLLGYPLKPLGPYFPGFTLSAALAGFIPGMLAKFCHKKWNWISLLAIISITELISSVCLNPLWLSIITGKAFVVFLPSTLISRAILIPIHASIVKIVLKYSKQVIPSLQ